MVVLAQKPLLDFFLLPQVVDLLDALLEQGVLARGFLHILTAECGRILSCSCGWVHTLRIRNPLGLLVSVAIQVEAHMAFQSRHATAVRVGVLRTLLADQVKLAAPVARDLLHRLYRVGSINNI